MLSCRLGMLKYFCLLFLFTSIAWCDVNYQHTLPGNRSLKKLMEQTRFVPSASSEMVLSIRPRLQVIMYEVWDFCNSFQLDCPVWTSIIRPQNGDSGIHATGRAFDLRTRNIPEPLQIELCDYINKKYPYDLYRPHVKSCLLNDGGNYAGLGPANHLHFQVPS